MSASLFPRINLREGSENLGVKTESQPTEYNNWIMLKELYLEASSHSHLYGSYQTGLFTIQGRRHNYQSGGA